MNITDFSQHGLRSKLDILRRELYDADYETKAGYFCYDVSKEIDRLRTEVASLKKLSVTNILIDVVPGEDGMGHEVYAKSAEEVVALLTKLSDKAEGHENTIRRKNKDISSWIQKEFAGRKQIDALTQQLAAANGRLGKLVAAATPVLRNELDKVEVHPCDYNDDAARARQCTAEVQELLAALKEQNALLTVQVQEALTRMDRARYLLTDGNPTPNCNWGMLDTSDIKAAHPQQVKSEDARDALLVIARGDARSIAHADQCAHGKFGYEDCELCICDFAMQSAVDAAESDLENILALDKRDLFDFVRTAIFNALETDWCEKHEHTFEEATNRTERCLRNLYPASSPQPRLTERRTDEQNRV